MYCSNFSVGISQPNSLKPPHKDISTGGKLYIQIFNGTLDAKNQLYRCQYCIHHYPRALFYNIPRVGCCLQHTQSRVLFTTYPESGAVYNIPRVGCCLQHTQSRVLFTTYTGETLHGTNHTVKLYRKKHTQTLQRTLMKK